MKKVFLLLAATSLIVSCTKTDKNPTVTTGTEVTAFEGKAWSSVQVTPKGQPLELSLVINDALLNSAPTGDGANPDHMANTFIVPLSDKATEATPFKFIMLNWNPFGHEPDDVYTLPHFDIHFFMTTPQEVMGYMDMAKLDIDPAEGYIPANHLGGAPVPMMGKHWLDVTSPEWGGATFTETFIYGSYDGKVVFYEPMITQQFLKNTNSYERAIPQPQKFQASGFYPTKMKVKKKNGTTEVSLTDFVYRQAS